MDVNPKTYFSHNPKSCSELSESENDLFKFEENAFIVEVLFFEII